MKFEESNKGVPRVSTPQLEFGRKINMIKKNTERKKKKKKKYILCSLYQYHTSYSVSYTKHSFHFKSHYKSLLTTSD